jgi:hypothetical protein
MRAVVAHSGVVRSFYVRQKSHAVGKPIAIFFGRRSAVQFAAEILVAGFVFLDVAADVIAALLIALLGKFSSKFNIKGAVRSPVFAAPARVCVA